MEAIELYKDDFCLSTAKARLDIKMIHQFLSTEAYWSKNIPYEKVVAAINHSLNIGVYYQGRQAAYARIISDFSTIAYLGDVFVLPEFRGQGLSKWMLQAIMDHPSLQALRRWILLTGDAHELYRQFGFTSIANPGNWMELHDKEVYNP